MTRMAHARRGVATLAVAGAASLLGACDSLLLVENPAAILDEDLSAPQLATVLANSTLGELQAAYDDLAYFSAILSDEAVTGHNFETWKVVDLRDLRSDNGTMNANYNNIHAMRFLADTVAGRLKNILPGATSDLRLATALAVGGYSYVFAGEFLCESPVNVSAEIYTPDELTAMAIPRFLEAIQVATAARDADADVAEDADDLINLARVGAGRAYLQIGQNAEAAAIAAQVPDSFVWWIRYSTNSTRETNLFNGATTGNNRNLGVAESFRNLNDNRVRHTSTSRTGHNQLTLLWTPYQAPSFGEWTGSSDVGFDRATSMRLASGIEARYIVAEAGGMSDADLLDFVNERRAVGGQAPVDLSGAALRAELRDQRRRDFFLDGHRLGDIRRYKKFGVGDFFPAGEHPNAIWGDYRTGECIPLPNSERIGNPNI